MDSIIYGNIKQLWWIVTGRYTTNTHYYACQHVTLVTVIGWDFKNSAVCGVIIVGDVWGIIKVSFFPGCADTTNI